MNTIEEKQTTTEESLDIKVEETIAKEEIITKRKKRTKGSKNRDKGHNAERLYVNIFKELGFDKCITARYGSHMADNAKVDLLFIPINVQIKAGYSKGLNPSKVLEDMHNTIKSTYPAHETIYNNLNVMIHHKDVGMGHSRNEFHSIVSMTSETFFKLFKMAYLKNEKTLL